MILHVFSVHKMKTCYILLSSLIISKTVNSTPSYYVQHSANTKPTCRSGWTLLPNTVNGRHCFKYVALLRTWEAARTECVNRGGFLAELKTSELYNAVKAFMTKTAPTTDVWLAGTDEDVEGTWRWSSNNDRIVLNEWVPGLPSGLNTRNCLLMARSKTLVASSAKWVASPTGGKWVDGDCSSANRYFLCQYDIIETTTTRSTTTVRSTTTARTTTTARSKEPSADSAEIIITVVAVVLALLLSLCLAYIAFVAKRKYDKSRARAIDTAATSHHPTTSSETTHSSSGDGNASSDGKTSSDDKASNEGKSSSSGSSEGTTSSKDSHE